VDRPLTVVGPRPVVIAPATPTTIAPPPRFAWDEKRWRQIRDGNAVQYLGPYKVWDRKRQSWRSFDGRIIEEPGGIKAYVADPPGEIKSHAKGPCFQLTAAPWFRVHWHRAPENVDGALLYVERLLDECLNGGRP
jgi:hypothetical protein